jgi:hypothetical protein
MTYVDTPLFYYSGRDLTLHLRYDYHKPRRQLEVSRLALKCIPN